MSTMKARRPLGSLTHTDSMSKSSSSSGSLSSNRSALKKGTSTSTSTSNTNVFASSTASKSGALVALDSSGVAIGEAEITVEQFLEQKCQAIMDDVKKNADELVAKLQADYAAGAEEVRNMLQARISANARASSTTAASMSASLCLLVKCTSGPHIGQKFRLELSDGKEEDTFKVGRSTGRAFKEKGLSLYKDKEVSTGTCPVFSVCVAV